MLPEWLLNKLAIDIALWFGTACIVGAYAYNSWFIPTKKAQLIVYQIVNLVGTAAYIYGMSILAIYQSLVLNIVWGTIGLIALVKLVKTRH